MDDDPGFARWSYPLLPMVLLSVAGGLTPDDTGARFPPVAVGVLAATAGFAVLMLPRRARFFLAASEGFLWTIAIASLRTQCVEGAWLTLAALVVAVPAGIVMAYLGVAMVSHRSVATPLLLIAVPSYVGVFALAAVQGRPLLRASPFELPSSWLWLAGGGLVIAVACAVAWLRRLLLRRSHPPVPADGPYRQAMGVPDAPRERASAFWRYARLLALAAMLPAGLTMAAQALARIR